VPQRSGHGWWPYLTPLFSFLALLELGRRVGPALAPAFSVASVLVPFALLVYFAARTGYPELRRLPRGPLGLAGDVGVGLLGAALWVAPYLWFPALRPEPGGGFDPAKFGAQHVWFALSLRAFGYGVVTPFVEELFVRSWLARYADVFDRNQDFRDMPIGRYSGRSFATVTLFFAASHMTWEWPVAIGWIVLTQLWFYQRKNLLSLVIVHAVSNLAIFGFVLLANGKLSDASGALIDVWFFL
jgi:CAAX prenyl protease-like protein